MVPARPGETAHHPVGDGLDPLLVVRKIDDEARKSAAHSAECHAAEQQLHRVRTAAEIRDEEDADGDGECTEKGRDPDGILAERRTDPEEDGGGCAERGARGDTEDVGIGERILYDCLHDDAAGGKPCADDGGEQEARQTQQPHDVVYRAFACRFNGGIARQLVEDRSGDHIRRQIDRPD